MGCALFLGACLYPEPRPDPPSPSNPPDNQTQTDETGRGRLFFVWDAPTTNADGTPLEDLAGYKLYRSLAGGQPTSVDVGVSRDWEVVSSSLDAGEWSFWVTAYDLAGNESERSNVVTESVR